MKILVIEDDQPTSDALMAVLTQYHYVVEVAVDGESGWSLLQMFAYDLILLDILLPKLDGISLCRKLRSQGMMTPILLLTAKDSGHDKAVGLDAGADDYVVKPFDAEELIARIRALLRRSGEMSQPILCWGDLHLDPSSCEVHYQNQNIPLTPKEYALLELFLRHPKRVFSCASILDHLWSYEEAPGEEAVRTHIKCLRQKLRKQGVSGDVIETVYGVGYRLRSPENLADPPRAAAHGLLESTEPDLRNDSGNQSGNGAIADVMFNQAQSNAQQTLTLIQQVWHQSRARVQQQVTVIEQAIAALESPNRLEVPSDLTSLIHQAIQEAHTLIGSLGIFGFFQGSDLARQIERRLKEALTTQKNIDLFPLWQSLRSLQELLQQPSPPQVPSNSDQLSPPIAPRLVFMTKDSPLAAALMGAELELNMQIDVIRYLNNTRSQLQRHLPDLLILDLDIQPDHQPSLQLLRDLRQKSPQLPIIVLTHQADLRERLQVVQSRAQAFLVKSPDLQTTCQELIQTIQQKRQLIEAGKSHILVVDDDPATLALLQNLLHPWELRVTALSDPQQFWQVLESSQPDLLILDVNMPDISGIELCQTVRNDPHWSELPILFLTASQDAGTINQVFNAGGDDFIAKPIVGSALITRVVNRLDRMKLLKRHADHQKLVTLKNSNLNLIQQQRQWLEKDLRSFQDRMTAILEIADDAIITINQDQTILTFNQGAERIFGYSAPEVIGKPLDTLLPDRFVQLHRQHVRNFGHTPDPSRRMGDRPEVWGRHKDGTEFPAEASIAKVEMAGQRTYMVILRDITQRKRVERIKNEFVSVVSHELRTPLTSIHGSLQLLARGLFPADSPEGQRLLTIAADSTDRLVRLINDILDIERMESGRIPMEFKACSIAAVITEAQNLMQPIANAAQVQLDFHSLDRDIYADRDRLLQILANLLSNAIKFSQPHSHVQLQVEQQNEQILWTIADQGRGIPAEQLSHIFEPFYQVDSSDSRNHDGTGLGLAICHSIVQQHGGKIWVESELGRGSRFFFTIPFPKLSLPPHHISLPQVDARPPLPELPSSADPAGFNPVPMPHPYPLWHPDEALLFHQLQAVLSHRTLQLRVLIVEPNPDWATALTTRFTHYQLHAFHARTGSEVIQLAQTIYPHLLVLDLDYPEVEGFAVVEWLQQHHQLRSLPLLLCSSQPLDPVDRDRLQLGLTECLRKPNFTHESFDTSVFEPWFKQQFEQVITPLLKSTSLQESSKVTTE
ncbi:MAG: response regulator [Synechococcales bacterium]|nr:response regulator [Synechococcales bacterium]